MVHQGRPFANRIGAGRDPGLDGDGIIDFLTKDNSQIICASHGALYDILSGECVAGPCTGKFLNRIEAKVIDGMIIVRGPVSLR